MNEKQINYLMQIIKEKEQNFDFNDHLKNFISVEELKELDIDDLENYFFELDQDGEVTRADVIYYTNAIKYLAENDPSLQESLEIASEYGYTEIEKLNSELLASLLKTRNNEEDYNNFINAVLKEFEEGIYTDEEGFQSPTEVE